jgi:hypothetical protein
MHNTSTVTDGGLIKKYDQTTPLDFARLKWVNKLIQIQIQTTPVGGVFKSL